MKMLSFLALIVSITALTLPLGGCAGSFQARSVDLKNSDALLVNPDILEKGTGDQALYRYINPKTDIKKYSRVIIDPVIICKKGDLDPKARENYQTLANNAFVYLTGELKKSYQIVKVPEPGTMRVQFALIDAESTSPVRNFIGSVDPIGVGLSLVKFGATGEMMGAGSVTGEIKITDAQTDELLGAALDRRVGGRNFKGTFLLWANANDGLEYWAKRLGYYLCVQRGDKNCTDPD
jgi:hypothetical protein